MAPPTIMYNNTAAKYTKYEQTNSGLINQTEAALAKAMLSQDITTFNSSAPSGNMDTNFSVITAGSGSTQQLTHLMIDQQQADLGSVFAIAAEHNYDNTQGVTGSDAPSHLSFSTTSGSIHSNLGTDASGSVYVTNDSASFYDSQVVIQTDNSSATFGVNTQSTGKYTVYFDDESTNFNAEKAVNSRYSNYLSGGLATADPDANFTDPLAIAEHTEFNSSHSLYTENIVSRDSTTNMLSSGSIVTSAPSSIQNGTGQYIFGENPGFGTGYVGISESKTNTTNDEVFFGAIRLTQQVNTVIITGSAAGNSDTTLAMVPSDPGSNLPTSLNYSQFEGLFTSSELPYAGTNYSLTVREQDYDGEGDGVTGGYYLNGTMATNEFRGFSVDDTDVKRNTIYMRKCAEEGQNFEFSHQTVEIDNGDLVANRSFTGANADLLCNRVDAAALPTVPSGTSTLLTASDPNVTFPTNNSFIKSAGDNSTFHRVYGSRTHPYNSFYFSFTVPTIPLSVLDLQIRNTTESYQILLNGSNFSFTGGASGTFSAGDSFAFEATATNAIFYKNGVLISSVPLFVGSNNDDLYLYLGVIAVGDGLTNIQYGTSQSTTNIIVGLPIPHDTDENLNSSQYQNDYWVRSYFTEPSTSVSATYKRAEGAVGNTSNYSDFRVVYDSSEGSLSTSVLSDDRRARSYENFEITTIFPNTSVSGDVFTGSNFIGIDNGFAAIFQDTFAGINENSDYTFTSSSAAAGLIGSNEIAIMHLVNTKYLSNEDSLYVDGATGPLPYTNATVIGTNINFATIANPTDSTTTDLRIKLANKTGLSSSFSNDWSSSLSTGSVLQTDLAIPGIFGNAISNIMTNITSVAGNTGVIPVNFEIATNGVSDNQDSLNLYVSYDWAYSSLSGSGVILESDISLTGTNPAPSTTTLTLGSDWSLVSGLTAAVQNLLGNYNLVRNVETRTATPSFDFKIGAYNNIRITGDSLTIRTVYHTLVHKTTGALLADSYIKNINLSSSYLTALTALGYGSAKASRQIIGTGKNSTLDLAISDLYNFVATVQKRDGNAVGGWSDASPSYDFDGAHGNFTTFTLNGGAGSIEASIDITTSSNDNVVLDQPTYFIELSTGEDNTSYSVVAKKWNINTLADAQAISTWADSYNIGSSVMPSAGTSVSLSVNVTSDPVTGQPSTQPDVTITVTDTSGNVWANFVTAGVKATSSFNVLFSRRPVFEIVENYKEVTITVPNSNGAAWSESTTISSITSYKMAQTSTKLQVINGIELTFNNDTAILDNASYTLLGDYLQASLYTGYAGPYSSITQVTFANGLVIGDAYARDIDIRFYRGNSVRTAVAPATYEEFRWTRTPTQIYMQIVNTDANSNVTTYTDSADDLYNGSTHIVDDLSGTIGDLNLKFYGSLSRFRNVNTSYTSQDVVMSQPITIVFDSYEWTINNPFNTTSNGAPNAVSGSAVVSTRYYSIRNYTGDNYPMNIVASRVWIRHTEEEVFSLFYGTPPMYVDYIPEQFVGNPSTFNWASSQRIDSITYADMTTGRHIAHPSNDSESHIFIQYAPVVVNDFVAYFLLPRPQCYVDAIATDDVSSLPYNFDTATRTRRYFDIDLETNSHYPFAGGFGTANGIGSGTRVVNNMNIVFAGQVGKYTERRFDSDSNNYKIYIPSNLVTVDLYSGYSAHSSLDSGLNISTVYSGYIHKLRKYDITVSTTAVSDTNNLLPLNSGTFNNFDGTFIDGGFNARNDMAYDLSFTQDHTIISPSITSADLFGQLGDQIVNIKLEGFNPFMDLTGVAVGDRHLDLLPGDSVKLVLYGHTFTTNGSGDLVVEYVKYTTGTGYDFSTNAGEFLIQNLGFNASTRETATVVLKTDSSVLTATPYNFVNVCNQKAADSSFNSLTWVNDSTWAGKTVQEKQLAFSITCLSTTGQSKLMNIFGVSNSSPFRLLVCNYPNRVDLRSGDGSPIYVVNAFGKLMNMSVYTQAVKLLPETFTTTSNDVSAFMAFNNLDQNTI